MSVEPAVESAARRAESAAPPQPGADVKRYFAGPIAILGGPANVIMQLSLPPVGYGVVESGVDSGKYTKRPLKRLRTTLTYLAVAMLGTDDDRAAYRAAVNTAHRQVRSGPHSPVAYNAFDPRLQLWVAACLYVGFRDSIEFMHGPLSDELADRLYCDSMWMGTTLQVRPQMWPADRQAFEAYWNGMLDEITIDDTVRAYLVDEVFDQAPLASVVRRTFTPVSQFFTLGYLPPQFRRELGLDARWSRRRQRRFDLVMRTLGRTLAPMPTVVTLFPFNVLLLDMRRRARRGRPLI